MRIEIVPREQAPIVFLQVDQARDAAERQVSYAAPRFSQKGYEAVRIPPRLAEPARIRLLEMLSSGLLSVEGSTGGVVHNAAHPTLIAGFEGFGDQFYRMFHGDTYVVEQVQSFCAYFVEPTYWYGPRIYKENARLLRHIDRESTHLVSATICITSDLDGDWPLVLEDKGKFIVAYLDPGDMLLYEGVRFPHFRPFKLRGRFYAGLFLHYRPISVFRR